MKAKPLILAAFPLALIGGAVAGQNVSTDPVRAIADVSASLPVGSYVATSDPSPRTTERLPDHYAMETPGGRVEVHELSQRGRNVNLYETYQSWRPDVDGNVEVAEGRWDDPQLDARASRALEAQDTQTNHIPRYEQRQVAHFAALEKAGTGNAPGDSAPVAVPDIQTAETQVRTARVVDVQAALASQR